jgi:energy-coupling factor transporter ATP-binding protein EcfA2
MAARPKVNLLNLENVTVAHGTRVLLDSVSLGVSEGDRIGIVGRNGGGKTTLLATLTKAEEPHSGRVTHTSGLRVGVLTQDVRIDPSSTVHAAVLGDAAEHTWAGDARVREILDGLGLHGLGLDSTIGTMASRGWPSTSRDARRARPTWSSPTTAGSSTRSTTPPGRCTTAWSTSTRAATRPTSWRARSATAWPRPPSRSACSW